jgi:hypothetical protein
VCSICGTTFDGHRPTEPGEGTLCPDCHRDDWQAQIAAMQAEELTDEQRAQRAVARAVERFYDRTHRQVWSALHPAERETLQGQGRALYRKLYDVLRQLPPEERRTPYWRELLRKASAVAGVPFTPAPQPRKRRPKYPIAAIQSVIDERYGVWEANADHMPLTPTAYFEVVCEAGFPMDRKTFNRYRDTFGLKLPPHVPDI